MRTRSWKEKATEKAEPKPKEPDETSLSVERGHGLNKCIFSRGISFLGQCLRNY